jgi:tetratricopeptide (TPR) repeat protein
MGLFDIFIYWNSHIYYQARKEEDPTEKVALLEKSNWFFPLNDLVFYELGKSYFDLGISNLNDAAASKSYFQKSVQNLKKSVLINPASPFSHFYLGQSLLNLDLFSSGKDAQFYDEFRKAGMLAEDDSQISYEVGKIFLSGWSGLSQQDRNFTLETLKKVMLKKDSEKIALILNTWELNAKNYQVIEKILPEDAQIYRQYAEFLGEKSLSLEERHKYLAQAELLDFTAAKSEFQSGEMELSRFRVQEAFDHFKQALDLLRETKFYQSLLVEKYIDQGKFSELMKSLFLNLAKCRIEKGENLNEFVDYLVQYLNFEDQAANLGTLDSYLKDRGLIPLQFDLSSNDLDRLAFKLVLLFKQTKYDEIINFARELERSFVVVPEAKKKNYLRIMLIIGDSLQKTGYLYEAEDFYQKALQIDPKNLETLLRIRQSYDRLNEEKKLLEVNTEIEKVLTPKNVDFKSLQLKKGQVFEAPLVLDGQKIVLDIYFDNSDREINPLLSVFFNGRVVRDEYLQNGIVSIVLGTRAGENVLQVASVNGPISLVKLIYRTTNGNENLLNMGRTNWKNEQ